MLLCRIIFVLLMYLKHAVICHVINYDSVTVCDGVLKEIQCPPNENIHVLQGFYGKWRNHDCKGESVDPDNLPTCKTERSKVIGIVRDICHGKNTCTLVADKSVYGEPCPDNKAYLYVTFFCMKNGQKLVHHRNHNNEEVVTVPSHGYIIREQDVHLEEKRREKERVDTRREQLLKLNNPSLLTPNPKPEADLNKEIEDAKLEQKTKQISKLPTSKQQQKALSSGETDLPVYRPNTNHQNSAKTTSSADQSVNNNKSSDHVKMQQNNNTTATKTSDAAALAKQKSMIYDYLLRSQIPRKTASKVVSSSSTDNDVGGETLEDKKKIVEREGAKKSVMVVNEATTGSEIHKTNDEKLTIRNDKSEFVDYKLDKIADQLEKDDSPVKSAAAVNETSHEDARAATICNGESKLIACLPEEGIKIHEAFYGKRMGEDCHGKMPYQDDAPTCSALDARSNVEESCNGKQSCLLQSNENVYGKSLCPNVNKYLHLEYSCSSLEDEENKKHEIENDSKQEEDEDTDRMLNSNSTTPTTKSSINTAPTTTSALNATTSVPEQEREDDAVSRTLKELARVNSTQLLCNGEQKTIKCDQDSGLAILSAYYGKRAGRDCRGELGYRDDIPECNNPRAIEHLKKLCDNKRSCDISAERELFGDDTCPGVNKYLEVAYAC